MAELAELLRQVKLDDPEALSRITASRPDWRFPEADTGEAVAAFLRFAGLPECDTDSGTLPAESYAHVPARARLSCAVFLQMTAAAAPGVMSRHIPALLVFSVTHLQPQPWSDASSRGSARELLAALLEAAGCRSARELLEGKPEEEQAPAGCFGSVLDELLPRFTKERWKRDEALKHVFCWTLERVVRPRLSEHLERVFPAALMMSDDYCSENKVLGVRCLHHLLLNVPAADLRQQNRAEVLYHALLAHVYTTDATVLQVALPCLADVLPVLHKPSAAVQRKPSRSDQVLRLVLTYMEAEHKMDVRRAYAQHLRALIGGMGVGLVAHLKRLQRVMVGYLAVPDAPGEEARLAMLDVLETTLQRAWPRLARRAAALGRALVRLVVDVSGAALPVVLKQQLLERGVACLRLLSCCCSGDELQVRGWTPPTSPPHCFSSAPQELLRELEPRLTIRTDA